MPDTENKRAFYGNPFTDGQIGILHGLPHHTLDNVADLTDGEFPRQGGLTVDDSGRSLVDHFQVDRRPLIAHPFEGPHNASPPTSQPKPHPTARSKR